MKKENEKKCGQCESENLCTRTTVYTDETATSLEFNIVEITTTYCFGCGLYTVIDINKSHSSDKD